MTEPRVGCCGWAMGKALYFAEFPVVELQSTFYEPPSVALAQKWRGLAPEGFEFCMKAWQLITHTPASPTYRKLKSQLSPSEHDLVGNFQGTEQVLLAWERTALVAAALRATVVLFQCPKSFEPTRGNVRNLRGFFREIGPQPFVLAWEPRGEWAPELVADLCSECDLVHCVDPLLGKSVTDDFVYWRLHGMGGYRHKYTDEELQEVDRQLRGAVSAGAKSAYLLFNNVWMKDDVRRFRLL